MLRKIGVLFSLVLGSLWGQGCPTTFPSPPTCDGCKELTVWSSGIAVVPKGETQCVHAGAILSVSEVRIEQNATLIVCGAITIKGNFNLNDKGASLWVAPGGSVTVQGNTNLNTQVNIYNFGTFYTSNLNLNGGNAAFWNIGAGAQVKVEETINVNASSQLINHQGIITAAQLTLNGTATACLSEGACLSVKNFTSNGNGAVQVTGGSPVALSFTSHATLNSQVTSSSQLYVCQAPGATVNNAANWGPAQVTQDCTSGCGVLPVKSLTLNAIIEGDQILLKWRCSLPCASYRVVFESKGEKVKLWEGLDTSLVIDKRLLPLQSIWTFWVVGLGSQGQELAYAKATIPADSENYLQLFPSPFTESLFYFWNGEDTVLLSFYTTAGVNIGHLQISKGAGTLQTLDNGLILASLPKGIYIIQATLPSGQLIATFYVVKAE